MEAKHDSPLEISKSPPEIEGWDLLGQGSFNWVYKSKDGQEVLKIPKDPTTDTDIPDRAVRLWNAINGHLGQARCVDTKWGAGWICPFIKGDQASDEEIVGVLINIFNKTGRIVIDAVVENNCLRMSSGEVVCVDIGLALQLERREDSQFAAIRRKSIVSLNTWNKLESIYRSAFSIWEKSPRLAPIKIIKALIFIKNQRPDICNADFLKTNPRLIIQLATAFDKQGTVYAALELAKIVPTASTPGNDQKASVPYHEGLMPPDEIEYGLICDAIARNEYDLTTLKAILPSNVLTSLFSYAVLNNHFDTVKFLWDSDMLSGSTAADLGDVLIRLIDVRQDELAKSFLNKRVDIDKTRMFKGDSALHLCMRKENPDADLVKMLYKDNPNCAAPNKKGETPLLIAVRNRHFDCAAEIFRMPEIMAAHSSEQLYKIVESLAENENNDLIVLMFSQIPGLNERANVMGILFSYAVRNNHFDTVKFLWDNDMLSGSTAADLGDVLIRLIDVRQDELAKSFLNKRADIDKTRMFKGDSALHLCMSKENPDADLVQMLYKDNPNCAALNEKGESPLLIAVRNRHFDRAAKIFQMPDIMEAHSPEQLYKIVRSLAENKKDDLISLIRSQNPWLEERLKLYSIEWEIEWGIRKSNPAFLYYHTQVLKNPSCESWIEKNGISITVYDDSEVKYLHEELNKLQRDLERLNFMQTYEAELQNVPYVHAIQRSLQDILKKLHDAKISQYQKLNQSEGPEEQIHRDIMTHMDKVLSHFTITWTTLEKIKNDIRSIHLTLKMAGQEKILIDGDGTSIQVPNAVAQMWKIILEAGTHDDAMVMQELQKIAQDELNRLSRRGDRWFAVALDPAATEFYNKFITGPYSKQAMLLTGNENKELPPLQIRLRTSGE